MEEAAAALSHSIDAGRKDKSQLLADIVETEKQVKRCLVLLEQFSSSTKCSLFESQCSMLADDCKVTQDERRHWRLDEELGVWLVACSAHCCAANTPGLN